MKKVVGFGDFIVRLSPPGYERFIQASSFNINYTGAEANVLVSLAQMGVNTEFEETTISIFPEKIVYVTYQHNGWKRKNIYWRDGTREEMFDGRWKTRSDAREV